MTQEEFKAINASAEDIKYNLQSDLQRSIIKLSGNWKNITSVCIQLLCKHSLISMCNLQAILIALSLYDSDESSYFGYFLFLPVLSTFMRILKLGSFALSALLSLALVCSYGNGLFLDNIDISRVTEVCVLFCKSRSKWFWSDGTVSHNLLLNLDSQYQTGVQHSTKRSRIS